MAKLKYQNIINQMSLEEKVAFCSGANNWTTKPFAEHGIPSIWMADGPHGLRKQPDGGDEPGAGRATPATCFPTASATACSWDRDLLRDIGQAVGEEALQEDVSIVLGPGVNIKRNPLCGRNFEYFSEDPYLSGELVANWVKGVQSQGIGVSVKHFTANNQENLRMQSDSIIDERSLREIYLAAFETVVRKAQPATVMCAYNLLNGTYCSDNVRLMREILRDEWGFEGVVITDWGAMNDRISAFRAGTDLEMPGGVSYFDQIVIKAVQDDKLEEAYLDESVDRLLTMVFAAQQNHKIDFHYDPQKHHQLARRAAAQSAVLLRNESQILPLLKEKTIAVIGALAKEPRYQGAGSSFVEPTVLNNALEGFDAYKASYAFYPGYVLKGSDDNSLLKEAIAGASDHDITVVFIGLTEIYEAEGFDRKDMALPPMHNKLVEAVAAANPNTVVVLAGGAPVEMPWLSKVKAVLHMNLAGQAGGLAAADLLLGAAIPCGKLAESYPRTYADVPCAGFYENGDKQAQYREGLYVGYRYYDKTDVEVAFPFGFGLSYTTFTYSDLVVSEKEIDENEELIISATIRNTGKSVGAEIVQLYVRDLTENKYRPEQELKGFEKVFLEPGEQKQVKFKLNRRSFAIYDPKQMKWVVPEGEYAICLAASSRDVRLQQTIRVHGTKVPQIYKEIPDWYLHPSGKPTQSDFEGLIGRKIEPLAASHRGTYSMECSLMDMQGSLVIRFVTQVLTKILAKRYGGVDNDDPNFKMMLESLINTPLNHLVPMSGGDMPPNVAQGLVHLANGRLWKGLKAFL